MNIGCIGKGYVDDMPWYKTEHFEKHLVDKKTSDQIWGAIHVRQRIVNQRLVDRVKERILEITGESQWWASSRLWKVSWRNQEVDSMQPKIEKLTADQEKALDTYAEYWVGIGCSTERIDMDRARAAIDNLYVAVGLPKPEHYLIFDSPDAALKFIHDETGGDKRMMSAWLGGGLWAGIYGWYDYVSSVLGVDTDDKLAELMVAVGKEVSLWWPFCDGDRVVVLADRPTEIHWNENDNNHCDGGPAIVWADGSTAYTLNGVAAPQWLAETRAEDIDPSKIREIDNVEVRREFVRKIGIERIYQELGADVIDKKTYVNDSGSHTYELVLLNVYEGAEDGEALGARPYLKMTNPSLPETYHLERVPVGTKTVRAALLFRNSLSESQVDDENGAEWYQQGDVILRPKDANKYKFFPKILT